jgi:hypothetical protein
MSILRPALFLLLLMIPASLSAQDVLGFSLGGGVTLATGDVTDSHGTGPNLRAATVIPLSDRFIVQATIGYEELRVREDEALVEREYDPPTFRLGGGFIEGGDRRILALLGHAQYHLMPRSARISPYALAGAGVSQIRLTDLEIYFLGEWENEPGASEIALTADVGGGVQVRLSQIVSLFAQGSYQTLFTDGGSTSMVPVHVGLLLELGRE